MKTAEEFLKEKCDWLDVDVIYTINIVQSMQEYSAQQLAEFKAKLKDGISNMYIGTTQQQYVPVAKFIELIDTL